MRFSLYDGERGAGMKLKILCKKTAINKKTAPVVYLNGRIVRFEKGAGDEAGFGVCETELGESGAFEVRVVKKSLLTVHGWFWWTLLFWVMGIFGIFAPRFAGNERFELFYSASGELTGDGEIRLFIDGRHKKDGSPAVTAESGVTLERQGEFWVENAKVKKRKRGFTALTIIFWLAAIAGIVAGVWIVG